MTETFSNLTTSIVPRPMNNGGLRQRKIDTIVVHQELEYHHQKIIFKGE